MTDAKSGTKLLPSNEATESTGKQYFKQAWTYSQRIELASRGIGHTLDLYNPKLQDLRGKLREKCVDILLLTCSYRRKAEELLWKKGFYDLVQRSKSNKQALDGCSPLFLAYNGHLSMATTFYTQLLDRLENHHHLPVTSMDPTQLSALDASNVDYQWLKEAAYRCILYLGDLARYRVDIGGKPYAAVTHYHHAISMDPDNGAPFNQLAALSGDKHEGLDAVYYYMRSVSSAKPFPGTEVNLQRIFRKTPERLESLRGNKERATEANIRVVSQSLLLARLVTLQHILSSPEESKTPQTISLSTLCDELLSDLEECLTFDLQLFVDMCPACVCGIVSCDRERGSEGEGERRVLEEQACLPSQLLLKVVALCLLSSTTLREKGSSQAAIITKFTVSIFSLLLHHSLLRLSHLTRHTLHTLTHSGTPVTKMGGAKLSNPELCDENMVEIFLAQLKGEVLDEYAQQTPGMAQQPKANSAPAGSCLSAVEAVERLSINSSVTWGQGGTYDGSFGNGGGRNEEGRESFVKESEGGIEEKNGESKRLTEDEPLGHNKGAGKKKGDILDGDSKKKQRPAEGVKKKQKQKKVVNRRRQRRKPGRTTTPLSSEEEEEEEEEREESDLSQASSDSSGSTSSSLSDSSYSPGEEEEEEEERGEKSVEMIESLSETSLSDEEARGGERESEDSAAGSQMLAKSALQTENTIRDTKSVAVQKLTASSSSVQGTGSREDDGAVHVENSPTPRLWTSSILRTEEGGNDGGVEGGTSGGERVKTRGGRPGKRQIVLAANFGGKISTPVVASGGTEEKGARECRVSEDDQLFQTLLLQTRHQAALHLACSLAAEDTYLMLLKIVSDWLTEQPQVIASCAQDTSGLWSRLATLLNFLPPANEVIAAVLRTTLPPGMEWSQTNALYEDSFLRGFSPFKTTHQQLMFDTANTPEALEQACNRICVLHKFGHHIAIRSKATVAFQWDSSGGKFQAPAQREREKHRLATASRNHQEEKAAENRSKLMRAMAQRRLQSEVDSLAETSAQQAAAAVFTPYLLPDALTLCSGLHLVRKLIASEKFIVVIAKSVIDSLDSMKKGKENYAAREAIKFLECSLQEGAKMVRAQADDETLTPGRKKPPKMDLDTWRYSGLVDCALYFTHTFAERGNTYRAATTLLLDRSAVRLVEGGGRGGEGRWEEEEGEVTSSLASVLSEAQLNGIPIETVVRFHRKWKQSQPQSQQQTSSHRYTAKSRR